MIVGAAEHIEMDCGSGRLGKGLHEMDDIFASQLAEPFTTEPEIHNGARPAGKVNDAASQHFIERGVRPAESHDAGPISERWSSAFPSASAQSSAE